LQGRNRDADTDSRLVDAARPREGADFVIIFYHLAKV